MSDPDPGPWIGGGLAGALIAWLWKQLADVIKQWKSSDSDNEKEFRERMQADIKKLDTAAQYTIRQLSDMDGRIRVLEDRSKRGAGE